MVLQLLLGTSPSCFPLKSRLVVRTETAPASLKPCCFGYGYGYARGAGTVNKPRARGIVAASCLNPDEQPILKEAFKEPVAFLGGMFAGVLRLDLNEEPLKEWVSRTVEASGITEEEVASKVSDADEEAPQEIEIE